MCLKSASNMDAQNKISPDCYVLVLCCFQLFIFMDINAGLFITYYFDGWKGEIVRCYQTTIEIKVQFHRKGE